jgi:hypothetical protein
MCAKDYDKEIEEDKEILKNKDSIFVQWTSFLSFFIYFLEEVKNFWKD